MVEGSGGAAPGGSAEDAGRRDSGLVRPGMLFASLWLIPAVLGALLGTVGWLISGWPWWPPIGAVTLWSAAFLIPRYWPGLRTQRWSLLTELLLVFSARKGLARLRVEEERRFRRATFPLYGLPASFPGEALARSSSPATRITVASAVSRRSSTTRERSAHRGSFRKCWRP
jgi:hypothetical protein